MGTNRLVRWDQRAPEGVVQTMSSPVVGYAGGKDYSRNTNFSCMATSGAACLQPVRCPGHMILSPEAVVLRLIPAAVWWLPVALGFPRHRCSALRYSS